MFFAICEVPKPLGPFSFPLCWSLHHQGQYFREQTARGSRQWAEGCMHAEGHACMQRACYSGHADGHAPPHACSCLACTCRQHP